MKLLLARKTEGRQIRKMSRRTREGEEKQEIKDISAAAELGSEKEALERKNKHNEKEGTLYIMKYYSTCCLEAQIDAVYYDRYSHSSLSPC